MSAKLTKSRKKLDGKTASVRTKAPATVNHASAKKANSTKARGNAKTKRVSALDAAAQVLKAMGKPMRAQELITAMAEKGLWNSPKGKTPQATLHAAMLREIKAKGPGARFAKTARGLFGFNKEAK